jgi:NH3-dependent NAD+ synthetase
MKAKPTTDTSPEPEPTPDSKDDDLWNIDYDELDAIAREVLVDLVGPERAKDFKSLYQISREREAASQREKDC